MNIKIALIAGAIAVLIATFFIDARLTPVVGAAVLLAAIVYAWASNRAAGDAATRKAERATRYQKEHHTGPRN